MNENSNSGIDVHKAKSTIGMAVVYYPFENKEGYPLRGILREVIVETKTLMIRFVYGEVGAGHEIEAFDMPVSAELCMPYGMWSHAELETLRSEIASLTLPKIEPSNKYIELFTDGFNEGDTVFLFFRHHHHYDDSPYLRLLPAIIERTTKTQMVIGGLKFRSKETGSSSIGTPLEAYTYAWREPNSKNAPVFENRIEMGVSAHTETMLAYYRQTVSVDEYEAYITKMNASK